MPGPGGAAAALTAAVLWTSDLVWGWWTMALLLGTGLFLSIRYRFVQITRFREALGTLVSPVDPGAGGALSPFQAFMTALAASIGTGNIAGVATAVVSGGPGAVFWIWCYGFFATSIKFTEAVLGIRFRHLYEGRLSAGPMHYLRDGLNLPRLAWIYALIASVAALTTTPFSQPNSIAVVMQSQFKVPALVSGVVVAILTWLVIIGGVKSIGRAAERLAPLKVILYLAGGLTVIIGHAGRLPEVLALIFREAFSLRAAGGSVAGLGIMVAMRYGLARGITSTISALTILVSGVWRSGLTSTAVVAEAFNTTLPVAGGWVVAFCALLFGYTTLIGWAYYGEQFLEYAFGPFLTKPYRWLYCGLIVLGATIKVETVWAWGDLMNGLQIFPNLVGVLGLSGIAAATLRGERKA